MNANKFFKAAEEKGIKPFELKFNSAESLSISVFMDDVEGYQISNDSSVTGRGIYKGKLGSFSSDKVDSKIVLPMMDAIISNASYGNPGDSDFFISKGKKYKKVHTFSEDLDKVEPTKLIDIALAISKKIRAEEKRITVVNVGIDRKASHSEIYNSNGLKLKRKSNYAIISVSTKIEDNGAVESFGKFDFISDVAAFDVDGFAKEVVKSTVEKLGGQSAKSGKYNVIYDREVVPMLLSPMLEQLSAFSVKQHLSSFEGKLGQEVLSKKITIKENPFAKNPFASSFDSEGIPSVKKDLIAKGVLKTFLYDLETAKEDKTESTGNASVVGGNIRPGVGFVEVKKGTKSLPELCAQIKNGLYINDLEGIGTGLNPQSGDYSLQAGGFKIEDGKITTPVSLITVAGNLFEDFKRVIAVASDSKVSVFGMETPSIAIKKIAVSGK